MKAVQREQPCLLPLTDRGEAAEIGKRLADAGELEGRLLRISRRVPLTQLEAVEQRQPAGDEAVVVGVALEPLAIGADATAMGMAENDDMRHLEDEGGIFDGGAGAVKSAFRLVGRHQIGDVPQDEQFAGAGIENGRNVDPGIAAGNHHRGWRLAELGELDVAAALRPMPVTQKPSIALNQALGQPHS